ncbi:hypothetical protein pb186bvf_003528 [Paramecium bursaria]
MFTQNFEFNKWNKTHLEIEHGKIRQPQEEVQKNNCPLFLNPSYLVKKQLPLQVQPENVKKTVGPSTLAQPEKKQVKSNDEFGKLSVNPKFIINQQKKATNQMFGTNFNKNVSNQQGSVKMYNDFRYQKHHKQQVEEERVSTPIKLRNNHKEPSRYQEYLEKSHKGQPVKHSQVLENFFQYEKCSGQAGEQEVEYFRVNKLSESFICQQNRVQLE